MLRLVRHCDPVVDALIRTSAPGYDGLVEAMHLVAGLEPLLVRRGEPLAATFARRWASLLAPTDADALVVGRALYEVRSAVVHGREVRPRRLDEVRDVLPRHRGATCVIALQALRWFRERPEADLHDWHRALDETQRVGSAATLPVR